MNLVTSAPALGGLAGLLFVLLAGALAARSSRRYQERKLELLRRKLELRRSRDGVRSVRRTGEELKGGSQDG